jgi:hypothetical protein
LLATAAILEALAAVALGIRAMIPEYVITGTPWDGVVLDSRWEMTGVSKLPSSDRRVLMTLQTAEGPKELRFPRTAGLPPLDLHVGDTIRAWVTYSNVSSQGEAVTIVRSGHHIYGPTTTTAVLAERRRLTLLAGIGLGFTGAMTLAAGVWALFRQRSLTTA